MVLSGYGVLAKSVGVDKLIFGIGSDRKCIFSYTKV